MSLPPTRRERLVRQHQRELERAQDAMRRQDYTAAMRHHLAAHRILPTSLAPLRNHAMTLYTMGHVDRAATAMFAFIEHLEAAPDRSSRATPLAEAWYNLGIMLRDARDLAHARVALLRALYYDEHMGPAWLELGNLGIECDEAEDAVAACYARAMACPRTTPDARWNYAYRLLALGRYAEAWPLWRERWQSPAFLAEAARPGLDMRVWEGEPVGRLLLVAEQGLGDMVHMARYIPFAQRAAREVVVEARAPLERLIASTFGVRTHRFRAEPYPQADAWVSLFDLPGLAGTTREACLYADPYLTPPPPVPVLGPGYHVGIAWKGAVRTRHDRRRSSPLRAWNPILDVPGVTFHALQVDRTEELEPVEGWTPYPMVTRAADTYGPWRDLADTAAFVRALDLVITVDTVYAHLAGAMGVPCWVLIAKLPDWRWGLEGERTPWYPSLRLYRQTTSYDWAAPIAAIAEDLGRRVATEGGP